jgi:hypothetical protein
LKFKFFIEEAVQFDLTLIRICYNIHKSLVKKQFSCHIIYALYIVGIYYISIPSYFYMLNTCRLVKVYLEILITASNTNNINTSIKKKYQHLKA